MAPSWPGGSSDATVSRLPTGPASRAGSLSRALASHRFSHSPLQRHRIIGLLLGYGADEIRAYEELGAGEVPSAWSRPPACSPCPYRTSGKEGTYDPAPS
jgi:hypothetical protein